MRDGATPLAERVAVDPAPKEFGRKEALLRIYARVAGDRIFSLAAASTYYGLLALFPAMAALVAIYGLFADPNAIAEQLANLRGLLPEGALAVLGNELKRIASQNHGAQGFAMVASIVVALWSANSAVKALFDSLNQVYGEKEERGFLKLMAVTLAFTVSAIALLALAMAGIVALPLTVDRLGLSGMVSAVVKVVRWLLLYAIVAIGLAFVYRFGPNRRNPTWKWILGEVPVPPRCGSSLRCCFLGTLQTLEASTRPTARSGQ